MGNRVNLYFAAFCPGVAYSMSHGHFWRIDTQRCPASLSVFLIPIYIVCRLINAFFAMSDIIVMVTFPTPFASFTECCSFIVHMCNSDMLSAAV